jgi:hypothetical protein
MVDSVWNFNLMILKRRPGGKVVGGNSAAAGWTELTE